jgi:pimeloyl-ACP methyl ester carboxylesterase
MVERAIAREDPYAGEDFERLDGDRSYAVTTPEGVQLAVREVGPVDAPLTMVFVHGFCLRMGAFHFQRTRLPDRLGTRFRMVFYDQRGHGRSGEAAPETYTLTQLGKDLECVLKVIAPRGVIVLVGHSMGGMTVLSHARQFPEQYGRRIVGAALISSAAEGVSRSPLGEILKNPALEAVRFTARSAPKLMHRGRNVSRSLIGPILRAASYSDLQVSRSLDAFSQRMMNGTPIATMVGFLDALEVHDETAGLWTLLLIPTLIACGDHDLVTPDEYSRKMAASLPLSELVIVTGASHLALLDKPEAINDGLVRLVNRAIPGKMALRYRRFRERLRRRD